MRFWLFSFLIAWSGLAKADPDLLRQLYGQQELKRKEKNQDKAEEAPKTAKLLLRESVSVQSERFYLHDVADCQGDEALCQSLNPVEIGFAPKPGRQERWNRERIAAIVAAEFPPNAFSFDTRAFVNVRAEAATVSDEAVRKALEKRLAQMEGKLRFSVQSLRVPTSLLLRHADYSFSFPTFEQDIAPVLQNPRRRYSQLRLSAQDMRLDSAAHYDMNIQVTFYVETLGYVSKSSQQRSYRLTAEDVEERWIPYQEQVLSKSSEVVGKLVRSKLGSDQAIRVWDLMVEPDIVRGERVEALVRGNGVKMNSIAQALESGGIGQKIRVRLEATKRNVIGTVIARSQVEVHMP